MRYPITLLGQQRRPIVSVMAESPSGVRVVLDALVDSGSDITLFPISLAERLKLDLTGIAPVPIQTALGPTAAYLPSELLLELRRPPQVVRWKATIGFLPRSMAYGILGTKGFFEHFDFHLWHRLAHFDVEQGRDA